MSAVDEAVLGDLRNLLSEFLGRNPKAEIGEYNGRSVILKPWGDPTIMLRVTPKDKDLLAALNSVHLPLRFSALWHANTKDVEFIYTAYAIATPLYTRVFDFVFEGRSYRCEFGDSSDALLKIAAASRPAEAPTDTALRNLYSYYAYQHHRQEHPDSELAKTGQPVSFWVRGIDYSENFLLDFARRLNFYMAYFDAHSPQIVVHKPDTQATTSFEDAHTTPTSFPASIRASQLDQYLLSLWESSINATDPFRRFIYLYQVLEYCAFYCVQEDTLRTVRRVFTAPDTLARVDAAAREILEAVVEEKLQEPQKFIIGMERCVDPIRLWEKIAPNAAYFAADVVFDGGGLPASCAHQGRLGRGRFQGGLVTQISRCPSKDS